MKLNLDRRPEMKIRSRYIGNLNQKMQELNCPTDIHKFKWRETRDIRTTTPTNSTRFSSASFSLIKMRTRF